MHRRLVKILLVGLPTLAITVFGAVGLALFTEAGTQWALRTVLSAYNDAIPGKVHVHRIEGTLVDRVLLYGIRCETGGGLPLIEIQSMDVTVRQFGLLPKRTHVSEVLLFAPTLHLHDAQKSALVSELRPSSDGDGSLFKHIAASRLNDVKTAFHIEDLAMVRHEKERRIPSVEASRITGTLERRGHTVSLKDVSVVSTWASLLIPDGDWHTVDMRGSLTVEGAMSGDVLIMKTGLMLPSVPRFSLQASYGLGNLDATLSFEALESDRVTVQLTGGVWPSVHLDGVIGVSHRGKTPPAMKGQSGLGKSRDTPMGFVTIRKEPFDDADVDFEFRCDACQWSSTEVMDLALGAHISRGTGRVEARIRALDAELENRLTTQAWALREWRWRIDVPDLASTARRAASVTTGRMPPISGKLSGEGRCKELDTGGRCNGLFRGTAVNTPWINTPCFTLAIDGTPDDLRHPFRGTLTMRQARLPNRGTLLQLQRPATLRFGRHDVVIEHFDVSMAGGQIALRGGLSRKGENHLTATVRHLELGQLAQITPGGDLGGDLNAKATVTGSGESVESALSLKVKGLRYRATDFGDLTLDATYRSRALSLVLDADGELAKRLRSSGRLLMSILAFPYGKVTVAPKSNRIRLKADGLPLGRLLPLFSTPLG